MSKVVSRSGMNAIAEDCNCLLKSSEWKYYTPKGVFDAMVDIIATMLAAHNEAFDRVRFIKAVYKEKS